MDNLSLKTDIPVIPGTAGLFICPGYGIHPARTIDSYELILVRSGNLDMFEEGQKLNLKPGETLLLWPGRQHGGTVNYPHNLSFYWVHFFLKKISSSKWKKIDEISVPQKTKLSGQERLTELFRYFLDEQESGKQSDLQAGLLIMLMLQEVTKAFEMDIINTGHSLAFKAHNYISANCEQNISTAKIAGTLQCNPDYLGRIFKKCYGHSLTKEIHRKKINSAKKLLMDSTLNIDEISAKCGFNNPVFFRRIFKRLTGSIPFAYRKMYSRIHINIR